MAQMVPEQTMALVLQVMQQISGPQAGPLLTQAGLGRFLTAPPDPTSMRPAASQDELIRLFRSIYDMLGENLTRLFMRNYGEATATALLRLPEIQQMLAEIRRGPRENEVRRFGETIKPWMERGWAPLTLTEDEQACYIAYDLCYACYGITGAKRPICAAGDVIFQRLAQEAFGRRVRVVEIECAATGGTHCKYAIYK